MASLARIALNFFIFCGSFICLQQQQAGQRGSKRDDGGRGVPCNPFYTYGVLNQSQYPRNCAPTPSLIQQQLIDNKLGLILG